MIFIPQQCKGMVKISSNSEMVSRGPLGKLAWNDPYAMPYYSLILTVPVLCGIQI